MNQGQAGYIPKAAAYREPDGGCATVFSCAGDGKLMRDSKHSGYAGFCMTMLSETETQIKAAQCTLDAADMELKAFAGNFGKPKARV